MRPKRVLLRERDFHSARIAILRELTGHEVEGAGTAELQLDGAASQCDLDGTAPGVDAVQILSLALAC